MPLSLRSFAEPLGPRPVFVMPHADDESYAFGGLLLALADLQREATLVSCTTAANSLRAAELRAAGEVLGLPSSAIICAGLSDGALDHPETQAPLQALFHAEVRDRDATALCILGPEGVYGHRDHTAVWRVAVNFIATQPKNPTRLVWPVFPDGARLFQPLRRYLGRTAPGLLDGRIPPEPPAHQSYTFALSEGAQTRKRAAIAAHQSQLPKGDLGLFLGRGVVDSLTTHETYAITEPR